MPSKCYLTRSTCPAEGCFENITPEQIEFINERCPECSYKSSSIVYAPCNPHYHTWSNGETHTVSMRLDDTCRYYGIARAKELKKEYERNREEF